jgi:phospholipid/cholesterol/gamma-HCH transport system permease protein
VIEQFMRRTLLFEGLTFRLEEVGQMSKTGTYVVSNGHHALFPEPGLVYFMARNQNWLVNWLANLGQFAFFGQEIAQSLIGRKVAGRDLIQQLYFVGVKSQLVVVVTGAFTGMVLAAQTYNSFHRVKMDSATLAVVSVSMCSQLGPVLTGLMVAGRVGAAMAAELGTMRVSEQIDALRTLATHPIDYLVAPRLIAALVALPLLTAESIVLGIGAAFLLAVFWLKIPWAYLWNHMFYYTDAQEVVMGMIKALVFGALVALISCFKGINCAQGAEGVGRATTEAVVSSSIAILISNFFLTLFLTQVLYL